MKNESLKDEDLEEMYSILEYEVLGSNMSMIISRIPIIRSIDLVGDAISSYLTWKAIRKYKRFKKLKNELSKHEEGYN